MSEASNEGLWLGNELSVIGVTGPFGSGKTLFTLGIDPNCFRSPGPDTEKTTIHWDTEDSATPFAPSLNFLHIRLGRKMVEKFPKGHKPIDLFLFWLEQMRTIQPGRFRVGIVDTISEIEEGLCDWVRANPATFGHTSGQYSKMEGLFWGDVKSYWKRILTEALSRFETFAFTSHTKVVWRGSAPTNQKTAKGKETLWELASLYLWLDRSPKPGSKTAPTKPSGTIFNNKNRLVRFDPATGELQPILPPRLPEATPTAIREYIRHPADYSNLKPEERAIDSESLSADDRLQLQAQIASDTASAEQSKLSLYELAKRAQAASVVAPAPIAVVPATVPAESASTPPAGATTTQLMASSELPPGQFCDGEQQRQILALAKQLGMPNEALQAAVERRGSYNLAGLTRNQADEIIEAMRRKATEQQAAEVF
jgi:hypothetical protein